MDQSTPLTVLDNSRLALIKAVNDIQRVEMVSLPVEGNWTIKDILGHISAWDTTCVQPLTNLLKSGSFTSEIIKNHDAWNQAQAEFRIGWSIKKVQNELISIRYELRSLITQLSTDQLLTKVTAPWGGTCTLEQVISGLAWHEHEHAKSIISWKSERVHE